MSMGRRHGGSSHDDTASHPSHARSAGEVFRRVTQYLKPYPGLAAATIGCALLSLASSFVYPRLTRIVIDDVIGKNRSDLLPWAIGGVLTAFLLRDVFNSIRILLNNEFEQRVILDIRRQVYARLQRLTVGWFDQRTSGDLMTRVIEDVNSVERFLIDGTEQGAVALLGILGVATLLFWNDPALALIALLPIPFLAAGALWYTLTAPKRYRAQRRASAAMNSLLMDNLQGVRQIKSFLRESHEDDRFHQRALDMKAGTLGVMRVWAVYHPAMNLLAALGAVLVLWFGGQKVLQGRMQVGQLIEFLLFLALFYEPVGRLHSLNQMFQAARAAGERVFDILDAPSEPTPPSPVSLPKSWRAQGHVSFHQVSFAYEPGRPALDSISLNAQPGDVIALVGPTGAGKSSLVNLIPRFYDATEGRICIDNLDIRTLPLEDLRRQIAVVSQEPFLFNGTIADNIRYGRLDASDDEVAAAAGAAHCHAFISRLPLGYATQVGERGVKLSVGEKQRISIARALLKNAPILILDEATASVDTATERSIQDALAYLMRGRTSFVIAHRLSTIRDAHQILVLQHGRILERGRHSELLERGGLYARLCRIQDAIAATDPIPAAVS